MDIFKRALKKVNRETTDEITIQHFLCVYRIISNLNTPEVSSAAELMFARSVKSVFGNFLPANKNVCGTKDMPKFFGVGDMVYIRKHS